MSEAVSLDRQYLWHPFTPHHVWLDPNFEPVVIVAGEGATLMDEQGRRYLDGNSSIWTNLHGHRRPELDQALRDQLDRIAHASFLGLTNDVAPYLARDLCQRASRTLPPDRGLTRCFLSDDGSTAVEAALKIAWQYFQQNGQPQRTRFISLGSGYHGDTVGAMSVGHSTVFHRAYRQMLFPTVEVMPPACYRCPFNKARPEKADARLTRRCGWECVEEARRAFEQNGSSTVAWVLEPRVQGAAGFFMHPHGYLERTAELARAQGALLILDEVMTGFGRTGPDFAFQHEQVAPDLVALAKGLTGGMLPLAATLTTETLFQGFGGGWERTFFHGHSYSGHPLGCATARASLHLLDTVHHEQHRRLRAETLRRQAELFWTHPHVGDVRQEGLILAVELVEDFATRRPFDPARRIGAAVCARARNYGLLTRPVGDVLLLMPPYCATDEEIVRMADALRAAVADVLGS